MAHAPSTTDLQRQINGLHESLGEIKTLAIETNKSVNEIKGNLCGINERCEAHNKRICAVEEGQNEAQKWTIGALFTGLIALVGMLWSALTRQ